MAAVLYTAIMAYGQEQDAETQMLQLWLIQMLVVLWCRKPFFSSIHLSELTLLCNTLGAEASTLMLEFSVYVLHFFVSHWQVGSFLLCPLLWRVVKTDHARA
jgi:hypothetical protein